MTREEMISNISPKLRQIEEHAKTLIQAVEILKRTLNADINFPALEEANHVMRGALSCNIKGNMGQIRKVLGKRAKARLKELQAF
jgi:hypothetical protein